MDNDISLWNKVFDNLKAFKVKRINRPNHPQLMKILEAHPELQADFAVAANDPVNHADWYRSIATYAPEWIALDNQKKAALGATVGKPTPAAVKLRTLFRNMTDNEPCTIKQAQHAVTKLNFSEEAIDRLTIGLEDGDPTIEDEWADIRWTITDALDEI